MLPSLLLTKFGQHLNGALLKFLVCAFASYVKHTFTSLRISWSETATGQILYNHYCDCKNFFAFCPACLQYEFKHAQVQSICQFGY